MNKLDDKPFLTFDLSDINQGLTPELTKFAKDGFDVEGVLQSAHSLKYTLGIKRKIGELMENPSEEFVRMAISDIFEGRFTAAVREQFAPMVKNALKELLREQVQSRISSALANTSAIEAEPEVVVGPASAADEEEIITTEEEREAFMIVRAIAREVIPAIRITMRDSKSYCAVLIDNNNRKPLVRLWFNRSSVKYVGLFSNKEETKHRVETLDQIYDFSNQIRATARSYAAGASKEMTE